MAVDRELVERWQTAEGAGLSREVLLRLVKGRSVAKLGVGSHAGRIDLRGWQAPLPRIRRRYGSGRSHVEEFDRLVTLNSTALVGLDFSGALMPSWRFLDSRIEECRFDEAHCQDWRLWTTEITATTWRTADLRSSSLGAWSATKGNTFRGVDFTRSDMRGISSIAATYLDCVFDHAKLDNVDFQSSEFVRCRFAGVLRGVIFWDHGFETGKTEPNRMLEVDFSAATLRDVEFRRLTLEDVRLPTGSDHVIFGHYPCVLHRTIDQLAGQDSPSTRGLKAYLDVNARWANPNREVGIFHRDDLGGNAQEVAAAVELLRRSEAACSAENT